MASRLLPALLASMALALPSVAEAASFTLNFSANRFANAGAQFPGYSGPVSGSIRWNASLLSDPITQLTGIDLNLFGHAYTLAEVGIANNGASQTAFGALVRGANAVVGDGQYDDFLIVFDRLNPTINAFAFSLQGKNGAIWWTPGESSASIVSDNAVPLPSSLALALLAGLLAIRRGAKATGRAAS